MSEQNKAALRRIYDELFTQGKLDVADEIVSPDAVDHENGAKGPEGLKEVVSMFRASFSDLNVTIEDIMADGDKVISRATFRGTHSGDFQGIAATGNKVEFQAIDIIRFADGKAVEHWGIGDNIALMQQIGAIPVMA